MEFPSPSNAAPKRRTRASTATTRCAFLVLLGLTRLADPAPAQVVVPAGFVDEPVAAGLAAPVSFAFVPTDDRLFVVEQRTGRVRLIVGGVLMTGPIVTVDSVRTTDGEQGLLGITVDPGWPARPFVYVFYDALGSPHIRIRRYTVSGDLAYAGTGQLTIDPASRHEILTTIPDANGPHNGGTLRFGPDGMLYASVGEDNAPCLAQDPGGLHGKILRLDVSALPAGAGGPPALDAIAPQDNPFSGAADPEARLVWQLGLRNPFRFHLDPLQGDAFIADVGQDRFEEIDWAPDPGMNFGWPQREANSPSPVTWCDRFDSTTFVSPIYVFDHASTPIPDGPASIVGGGVYRRPASAGFPADYEGRYFFTDYYRGYVRQLARQGDDWIPAPAAPGQPNVEDWGDAYGFIADMLVGPDGAIWYCQQFTGSFSQPTGQIRRIRFASPLAVAPEIPPAVTFLAPEPTPTKGAVTLTFALRRAARVTLELFDPGGRHVVTLASSAVRASGTHRQAWDGRDARGARCGNGIVLARLTAGGETHVRRILLMR